MPVSFILQNNIQILFENENLRGNSVRVSDSWVKLQIIKCREQPRKIRQLQDQNIFQTNIEYFENI